MADNIELASGSGGAIVRTDDDGTAHWQYMKLAFGADNTQTIVTSTATNPLPVALSDVDNAVLDNIQTSVDALAAIIAGSELQVDIVGSLPAGTNAIGKLAANSGVDIGDVDVLSLPGSITGYSEDVATPATIVGIPGMMERDDALATLTPIEGDWAAFRCSAEGALWVQDFNSDAILSALGGTLSIDWNGTAPPIGAGTEAAALRVTLATDSTGVVSVDDGGGALTVDNGGTFAVQVDGDALTALQTIDNIVASEDAASGGAAVGVPSMAVRDDSLSTLTPVEGDYVPLRVNSTGALHVTGGGGGTQYNVDDAAGATDTGTLLLAIRDDSLTTLTPVDGDYVGLRVSSTGALHVTGGGGGTEYTEDAAAAADPTGTSLILVRADTPAGITSADGDNVAQRGTDYGAAYVTLLDSSGTEVSGGTDYSEDVASPATIVGPTLMMERDDALATLTPIEGDWAALRCSAEGALWVQEFNSDAILADTANMDTNLATLAGAVSGTEVQVDLVSANVTNAGTFAVQVDGSALTALQLIDDGVYTHDAAGGTAVGMMGMSQRDDEVGSTAVSTADGDAQSLRSNKFGALKVTELPDATSEVKYAVIDAATSGNNTLVAAVGAGVKVRVLACMMIAAGTVTARFESGADGTALSGQMNLVANSGFTLPFNPYGWCETADNTLLNLELSAAVSVDGLLAYVEV